MEPSVLLYVSVDSWCVYEGGGTPYLNSAAACRLNANDGYFGARHFHNEVSWFVLYVLLMGLHPPCCPYGRRTIDSVRQLQSQERSLPARS